VTDDAAGGLERERKASKRRLSVTAIGTLIALISAAVALVFTLWPGLRPDPRSNREAEVAVFAVERGVSYGDYLRRTQREPDPRIDPALRGELIYAEARVQGFKRQTVLLRWSAYHADTRTRYRAPALEDVRDSERTQETPTDRFVQPIWVFPVHCTDRQFFVRVELVDSNGLTLAVADSKAFRGLRPPPDLAVFCRQPR
jgi:hypothetical protein